MKGRRGSTLVVTLLISVILLILGMAFLGRRALQYQGAGLVRQAAQARALAEAGLAEARLKLEKDLLFPLRGADEQVLFPYSEEVVDLDGATRVGSYQVTIDTTWRNPPYSVIVLTSVGVVGPPENPLARRCLVAELDVSPKNREQPSLSNPNYFRYLNWQDLGGL